MSDESVQDSILPPSDEPSWRELAERASKEPDPKKLLELVHELCDQLDRTEEEKNSVMRQDASK